MTSRRKFRPFCLFQQEPPARALNPNLFYFLVGYFVFSGKGIMNRRISTPFLRCSPRPVRMPFEARLEKGAQGVLFTARNPSKPEPARQDRARCGFLARSSGFPGAVADALGFIPTPSGAHGMGANEGRFHAVTPPAALHPVLDQPPGTWLSSQHRGLRRTKNSRRSPGASRPSASIGNSAKTI